MSVFVARLLTGSGDGPEDVATLGGNITKRAVVYEVGIRAVESSGFRAASTPNQDTPIGYAHASIMDPGLVGERQRSARNQLAAEMVLVHGTIDLPKPPGA